MSEVGDGDESDEFEVFRLRRLTGSFDFGVILTVGAAAAEEEEVSAGEMSGGSSTDRTAASEGRERER